MSSSTSARLSETGPVRLIRDRVTWLIYLQLVIFATYLYGMSAALPLLRIDQGVSQAVAGLHGTAMAVGGILTGLVIPWLVSRFGRGPATWIGVFTTACGALLVVLTSALPGTLLGYGLASGGGTVTLYVGMSVLSGHHGQAGPAAINEANAVGVTVGIGASYLISVLGQSTLGWRAGILITPIAAVLLLIVMGRVRLPAADAPPIGAPPADAPPIGASASTADVPAAEAPPVATPSGKNAPAPLGLPFHAACAVLFCLVATEFLFNVWAAKLLADQTGMAAAAAATGLTAFTAGIAVGRFATARLALRYAPTPLLVAALAITLVGWAVFWLSGGPVAGYLGLALSGLGVAVQFPLGLSRIIAASGGRPDRAAATASIWASVAVGVGPFALGAIADGLGTRTAFLMVPVLIALAYAGIALSSRRASPALDGAGQG
ncbi:MFS transporter [Sphaerisporangium aureirubrum]|uniref:MFS transporter n=1 Tax=Sphaerisporangium aureirubrum TaxID=1544736 RepID=A0ABW1NVC0_9ACTN